jgi:hypothetical protein
MSALNQEQERRQNEKGGIKRGENLLGRTLVPFAGRQRVLTRGVYFTMISLSLKRNISCIRINPSC